MSNLYLYNDDCFDVIKTIPDKSVDIAFFSPPYNRKRNDKYTNYEDTKGNYYEFLVETIEALQPKIKRHIFLNIQANYYNKVDVYKFIGTYANSIQQIFIWEKANPMPTPGKGITNAYEYFIVLGKDLLKSNTTYTKNHITTAVNSKTTSKIHKAVMSQEVSDWFIDKFTKTNDVVIDPFMGLGTTGVSCVKKDINFIGIEIDEEYFRIAEQRIKSEQKKS